ncbi:MAG: SGNH/GDSL hydrolase family protein [Myxococcus sp.]|nr:SGNH/GDSL hydrolase family protein [Myxococcus sp.]
MRPLTLCYALLAMPTFAAAPQPLERVEARRVFFGHQSVGGNVIEGLTEVSGGKLRVVEARTAGAFDQPGFVHTLVGRNEDPSGKVADFEKALDDVAGRPDIAFFKFCYVDFTPSTDVEKLFAEYSASLTRLQAKYPKVTFVHVTVPLTVVQTGAKAWLKRRLGRAPWGEQENAVRHRYNELLRAKLSGQPLFDLAALESTRSDGTPQRFELGGAQVPMLVPGYTDDGAHLNAVGRRRVAEALLEFLAKLP